MSKKINIEKRKRISPSTTAIIGSIILLLGGFFLSYNYIKTKKIMAFDYMQKALENANNFEIEENDGEKKPNNIEESTEITNNYIGYLLIPKLNFRKGFLDKRSNLNNIEQNITVIKESSYPDVEKGNLIIAAHSGYGWKAFFNDLYKLNIGDELIVLYKGKKYTYKITNIYKEKKTGKIAIYRNYDKNTLTLITCTNHDNTTQTIYISELEKVEKE